MCLKLPGMFLGRRELQVKESTILCLVNQAFWESIPIKIKGNLDTLAYMWEKHSASIQFSP